MGLDLRSVFVLVFVVLLSSLLIVPLSASQSAFNGLDDRTFAVTPGPEISLHDLANSSGVDSSVRESGIELTHTSTLLRKGWNYEEYTTSPTRKMVIYAGARYFLDDGGWKSHALSEDSTSYIVKVPYDNTGKPASLVIDKITGEITAHNPDNDLLALQGLVVSKGEDELRMANLGWDTPYENATDLYLTLDADLMLLNQKVATIEITLKISGPMIKPEVRLTAEVVDNYSIAWLVRSPARQLRLGSFVENFDNPKLWAKENIVPFGALYTDDGSFVAGLNFEDLCPRYPDNWKHDLTRLKMFETYKDTITKLSTIVSTFGDFDLSVGQEIVLDPATFYSTASDGHIVGSGIDYSSAHDKSSGGILADYVGLIVGQDYEDVEPPMIPYYVLRGFLFLDTSSIPDSATITSAMLSLYGDGDCSDAADFDVVVQTGQPTYPHDPLVQGDYYYGHYSGIGGSFNTSSFAVGGYNDITLNLTGVLSFNC